ncbi:MFS transporter [Pseudonocardia acaciae]|uniref:MFS transporter n=1 Tax=Pseudonocardia acaciae TaxID=551276 RepID=UPI0005632EF1|nr:MFS transporter [Pseudonocardia acaciae]
MTSPEPRTAWFRQLDRGQVKSFVAAWMGYALDGFDFVLITYVLSDIAEEFHLSLVTASSLVSAAFLTRWLGGALVGAVADHLGRTKAMVLGVLLYSGGTFLCGLSWDYWSLFAFRLVVGMGMAGEYAASSTYAMESWPAALRNKASGFLISGFPLGGILASQAYPLLVPSLGWRALFFLGLAPVVVALYIRFRLPESAEWERSRSDDKPSRPSVVELFGRRRLPLTLALLVLTFVAFCSNWPIGSLMPTYLKSVGFDAGHVGSVMFAANFGLLVGTCLAGFLGDRLGTRRTYVVSILVSLVLILPVFALRGGNVVLLGVLVFFLQLTNYGPAGILPKYLADYFDVRVRGAGLGLVYNLGALGGAVSPVLGAWIGARLGLGAALAVLTFGWTLLLAAMIGFGLPDRVRRRAPARQLPDGT